MTTYYVRKGGNDTTGDGSTGNPWLTIHKGISTIAAGNTLLIGDGTYAENSGLGYLTVNRAMASVTTVRSESGNADNVIVQGTSGSYNTYVQNTGGKWTFEDLTFTMRDGPTTANAVYITQGQNYIFNRCKFIALGHTTIRAGLTITENSGQTVQNITFNDCNFSATGSNSAYGANVASSGLGTCDTITFNNCTVTGLNTYPFRANGGTNVNVNGGNFYSPTAGIPAFVYGIDGTSNSAAVTGTISGATIKSDLSHACLIGAGASNVVVQNCNITGGDLGLVAKENSGVQFLNNVILNGTTGSIQFKAATGATATGNRVTNNVGGFCVGLTDGDTGHKSGTVTCTNNTLMGAGASKLFFWLGDAADLGGGVCDYNQYQPNGSAKFGAVRADADVQNITELRAAWAGYGDGSNDSHSSLVGGDDTAVLMMMGFFGHR